MLLRVTRHAVTPPSASAPICGRPPARATPALSAATLATISPRARWPTALLNLLPAAGRPLVGSIPAPAESDICLFPSLFPAQFSHFPILLSSYTDSVTRYPLYIYGQPCIHPDIHRHPRPIPAATAAPPFRDTPSSTSAVLCPCSPELVDVPTDARVRTVTDSLNGRIQRRDQGSNRARTDRTSGSPDGIPEPPLLPSFPPLCS